MEDQNTRRNNSKKVTILSILLLLALIVAAVLGWLAYSAAQDSAQNAQDAKTAKEEVASLEQVHEEMMTQPNQSADVSGETGDSDMIITEATAYVNAGTTDGNVELKIAKKVGDFARVSATSEMSGYELILKKSNDQWVVITSGQQAPPQDVIDRYEIPEAVMQS